MNSVKEQPIAGFSLNKMVQIPSGVFVMGAETSGWGDSEYPAHSVQIASFLLDTHHVTNAQFRLFTTETKYNTSAEKSGSAFGYQHGLIKLIGGLSWRTYATNDRENHPVVLVSWNDANAYSHWAGKRLVTEAEWEYAARGGRGSKSYPWGDEEASSTYCNMGRSVIDTPPTSTVMSYSANNFGLFDMAGNVWDLCADYFDETYYQHSPIENPNGPASGEFICRRGASFNIIQPFRCRNANRGAFPIDSFAINVGFRCAKTLN